MFEYTTGYVEIKINQYYQYDLQTKKKSCDAEHDDALPNLITVQTNNDEQITMSINKKNGSTRNEINQTIDCHNNRNKPCVVCFIDKTTTSKSQLARHYTSRNHSRTPQELQ